MIASDLIRHSGVPEEQLAEKAQILAVLRRTPSSDSLAACPECPAPMTWTEAQLYLTKTGKRMPTAEQWELAVRGVDGRRFPWGNKFDPTRLNAGLPRGVGWENRSRLLPSRQFPAESPFGLIDTVGNAGDWVELKGDPAFMGGCFNQNEEDCTSPLTASPHASTSCDGGECFGRASRHAAGGTRSSCPLWSSPRPLTPCRATRCHKRIRRT